MKLLNVQEIAELIGVKQSMIYQSTLKDCIPHIKAGKLVRFNADDLTNWISKMKTGGRKNRKYEVRDLGI